MEKLFYAALDWGAYHNLDESAGSTGIYSSWQEAPTNSEILVFDRYQDAYRAVEIFKRLCSAAWTPNQTPEERSKNAQICAKAEAELEMLRKYSKIPKNISCGKKTAVWKIIRLGDVSEKVEVEVPRCLTQQDELFHIVEEWVRQHYVTDDSGEIEYVVFSEFKEQEDKE